MKKLVKPLLFLTLCSLAITQTGCFGTFSLTKKTYAFHDGCTNNKFVKSLLFWIPGGLVYPIVAGLDAIIFNLIEFWSGSNPISMREGDHEMQLLTLEGIDYRIEATRDTFTTTQLSGAEAGLVRIMRFDRSDRTWRYTDDRLCDRAVMSFLDETGDHIRVYTDEGSLVLTSAELQDGGLAMHRLNAHCPGAIACN